MLSEKNWVVFFVGRALLIDKLCKFLRLNRIERGKKSLLRALLPNESVPMAKKHSLYRSDRCEQNAEQQQQQITCVRASEKKTPNVNT